MYKMSGYVFVGVVFIFLLLGSVGAWLAFATLNGAVLSTGEVAFTQNRVIEVIHEDGGRVDSVSKAAGDSVEKGDVLLRLDDSLLHVERQIVMSRLFEAHVRALRFQALLDNSPFPALPEEYARLLDREENVSVVVREREAYAIARTELEALNAQYEARKAQSQLRATALAAVIEGLKGQEDLLREERDVQRTLEEKGVARRTDGAQAEQAYLEIRNRRLEAEADLVELEQQVLSYEADRVREISQRRVGFAQALGSAAEVIPELEERLIGLDARFSRLEIRSPVDGVLTESFVVIDDLVVLPGATVGTIVPALLDPLVLAPIDPTQVNQVYVGQSALLRPLAAAYNNLEIAAEVLRISEGVRTDPSTGISYYEVTLRPNFDILESRGIEVVSGMPLEVALQTEARSPFSYFMEPVLRSFRRAFRE